MNASDRHPSDPVGNVNPESPSGDGDGRHSPYGSPREAAAQIAGLIAEYKEYLSYFISARIDGIRHTVRQVAVYGALGLMGLIAASATVAVAVALFLLGAARGLGSAFGEGMYWLGDLIIGLVVLIGVGLIGYAGMKWITASSRRKTVEKYEQRQDWQRRHFGHDVTERAVEDRAQRI